MTARKFDLHGMSVTAQCQTYIVVYLSIAYIVAPMGRIVAQQYLGCAVDSLRIRLFERAVCREGRIAYIFYSDQGQRVGSMTYDGC